MHVASPVLTRSRIGLVSTYPPTLCGLATFASALGRALAAQGHQVETVRLRGDHGGNPGDPPVVASIQFRDPALPAALTSHRIVRCSNKFFTVDGTNPLS